MIIGLFGKDQDQIIDYFQFIIEFLGMIMSVFQIRIRIRIRIHMFLGLPDPDPDPLVRGMDPDPDPSIIMQK
jgi:hypothetical protein